MAQVNPNRARYLVLKALAAATEVEAPLSSDIDDGVRLPEPGQMQLFSFFRPGLIAGDYTIDVSQEIVVQEDVYGQLVKSPYQLNAAGPGQTNLRQTFNVTAPQFSLPEEDFHSSYPPQGHSDQPNVAPHIVFSDPHLPWERDPTSTRVGAPWLAIFPFDCNHPTQAELRLSNEQLQDIKSALNLGGQAAPTATFSLATTIKDYLALETTISRRTKVRIPAYNKDPNYQSLLQDTTPIQLVFVPASLYRKLFFTNGKPDIQQFNHCAHVRNVNTECITGAGMTDTGLFSVVHSKRSGPTDISAEAAPRSQAVHLLSLEYLEDVTLETKSSDGTTTPDPDSTLVALVSLKSWTYLCEPPLSVNFIDVMRRIGVQLKYSQGQALDNNELLDVDSSTKDAPPKCYLRCPNSVLERLAPTQSDPKKMPDPLWATRVAMRERMENGYGLVRHRVQTGEETVALFRGALLPVMPRTMPPTWPGASNNGQDYQIFDEKLGLMDVTYSAAWQLGRIMASSDTAFVSALMRVRMRAYQAGIKTSNLVRAYNSINFRAQADFFSSLPHSLSAIRSVSLLDGPPLPSIDLRSRWDRPLEAVDTLPVDQTAFRVGVDVAIRTEGSAAGNDTIPIQDMFSPASEDWRVMHDWILDKMYLDGIPTHYLVTDSSMLPPESIRFFNIDMEWRNAFIDGALSCANHTTTGSHDDIRDTIKKQFETYLQSKILVRLPDTAGDPSQELQRPQVPVFGFFLRSKIISVFKDLIVQIPWKEGSSSDGKAPILVQKRLGSDILMVLLDRRPESGDIPWVKFTQPPHQQRFCVADYLDDKEATYLFRKIRYSQPRSGDGFLDQFDEEARFKRDTPGRVYDWDSRCLDLQMMEKLFFSSSYIPPGLPSNPFAKFHEENWSPADIRHLTSSFLGIQLNDTIKYLSILPPLPSDTDGETPPDAPDARRKLRGRQGAADDKKAHDFKEMAKQVARIKNRRYGDEAAEGLSAKPAIEAVAASATKEDSEHVNFPLVQNTPVHPPSTLLRARDGIDSYVIVPPNTGAAGPQPASYRYSVYPRETLFSDVKESFVWRDVPYAGDLIFSVQRILMQPDHVGLRELQITMPLGPSAGRKPKPDVKTIEGPGLVPVDVGSIRVRMLNNQRWVATVAVYDVYMQIRIVPRADPALYSETVGDNRELSFVVSGMDTGFTGDVDGDKNKELGKVTVTCVEKYGAKDVVQGTAQTDLEINGINGWKE